MSMLENSLSPWDDWEALAMRMIEEEEDEDD